MTARLIATKSPIIGPSPFEDNNVFSKQFLKKLNSLTFIEEKEKRTE